MTREAALRLGLAARELGCPDASALVRAVAEKLGLPLTETKLAAMTATGLLELIVGKRASEGSRVSVNPESLDRAVRLMWGRGVVGSELPMIESYVDGDMPGSIRVACASNGGEVLDGHFGSCELFLIYQVSPVALRLDEIRQTLDADYAEDRNASRAKLIADCQVVYVQSIGGPAAAKVIRAGVHPVKISRSGSARELLVPLQDALTKPPPWLAKIMGVKAASLEKFAELIEG